MLHIVFLALTIVVSAPLTSSGQDAARADDEA